MVEDVSIRREREVDRWKKLAAVAQSLPGRAADAAKYLDVWMMENRRWVAFWVWTIVVEHQFAQGVFS